MATPLGAPLYDERGIILVARAGTGTRTDKRLSHWPSCVTLHGHTTWQTSSLNELSFGGSCLSPVTSSAAPAALHSRPNKSSTHQQNTVTPYAAERIPLARLTMLSPGPLFDQFIHRPDTRQWIYQQFLLINTNYNFSLFTIFFFFIHFFFLEINWYISITVT